MKLKLFFFLLSVVLYPTYTIGQTVIAADSNIIETTIAIEEEPHSAKKAAIYAAALPGLGHIYNKKYWKLPLVYGGLGTSVYFIVRNRSFYNEFLTSYKARIDDDPNTNDFLYSNLSDGQVLENLELTRTWLELSIIATAGVYLLQIVDATVDAHLFDFDVSEDLSLKVNPFYQPLPFETAGVTLTLNFKK